jgi:hypothetical protein
MTRVLVGPGRGSMTESWESVKGPRATVRGLWATALAGSASATPTAAAALRTRILMRLMINPSPTPRDRYDERFPDD